jgi:hypothetical protein
MGYAWQTRANGCRFELHNTSNDRSSEDPTTKRRAEIHDKVHLCDVGKVYWGAFSFKDTAFSDPAGMKAFAAGSHFQMHMPGGGSPVWALRRKGDGSSTITTNPGGNKTRATFSVSFDAVHDCVYRQIIQPTNGELDVWIDGRQVLKYRGALSDSKSGNGYYPCYGPYYGSGMSGVIVVEYANIAPPSLSDLSARLTAAPAW